jgi:hypothetical protein
LKLRAYSYAAFYIRYFPDVLPQDFHAQSLADFGHKAESSVKQNELYYFLPLSVKTTHISPFAT